MKYAKECVAEFIGTFMLVFIGCGAAMIVGCNDIAGRLTVAIAFGLAIVAIAYSVGNVSGGHVNPVVSLAMCCSGRIGVGQMIAYWIAQFLGGIAGSGALYGIFKLLDAVPIARNGSIMDQTRGLATNGVDALSGNIIVAMIVECVLTFIFVIAILGVTDKKQGHGSFGGLVIGLVLIVVHIIGIPLTGTSVNPARSFGPALISMLTKYGPGLHNVWVFFVGPIVGSLVAAIIYNAVSRRKRA